MGSLSPSSRATISSRHAAGLEADEGHAGHDVVRQLVEHLAKERLRLLEEAVVVERAAAAEPDAGDGDHEAGGLQHLDSGVKRPGVERVVERVGPEDDPPAGGAGWQGPACEGGTERGRGEAGDEADGVDTGDPLGDRPQPGQGGAQVRKSGGVCGETGPPVDEADGVGRTRSPVLLVVVGEGLGLVRRHVDVDGAVHLAPLAREAQVERLLDALVPPTVGDDVGFEHLEQDARPPPRRVPLVLRGHVARAHGAALAAAAEAHTDASQRRLGEAATVLREGEVGGDRERRVRRAQAQVLVESEGVDDLAGVHLGVGVPDGLELTERLDDLVAEHAGEELGSRLAVAVLPRQ